MKSNDETLQFLLERNVVEPEVPWKCPECGFDNYIRWSDRLTPCGDCNFMLLTGGKKEIEHRISELEKELKLVSKKIRIV